MNEFDKMRAGHSYDPKAPEVLAVSQQARELMAQLNHNPHADGGMLCRALFDQFGEASYVTPPFYCEFGKTVSIGQSTFLNMGVTMLDNAEIHIGNNVLIGPNAQLYTPSHPLDYRQRRNWVTICKPIIIEDDVWIGGQAVICQGVTIGARSVVAANATVTKDVPPDTLVAGSPAKIIRHLTENESREDIKRDD
ncbi:Maltose O-acetyltransferase [Vibrio stylophorae]|uniref:Maltose O-acetyltransferase n=1 Tax=Vibrio stylophorae TaxID=659351 RepID=A0ABN8DY05_9VIBR|nr:sugar O-acetyltransferase [Vibrio stylophorae]CAH0534715.1 Maltose O-acetyltransferase [Vibrio stylophorae]